MTDTDKKMITESIVFIEDTIKRSQKFKHRSPAITSVINFLGGDLCKTYCETKKALMDYEAIIDKLHMMNMLAIANSLVDTEEISERTTMLISKAEKPLLEMVDSAKRMASVLNDAMINAPL